MLMGAAAATTEKKGVQRIYIDWQEVLSHDSPPPAAARKRKAKGNARARSSLDSLDCYPVSPPSAPAKGAWMRRREEEDEECSGRSIDALGPEIEMMPDRELVENMQDLHPAFGGLLPERNRRLFPLLEKEARRRGLHTGPAKDGGECYRDVRSMAEEVYRFYNKRAAWNSLLEKSLVDLLHEHNTTQYRGQNGWSSEAWNRIVKEFHAKNTYVSYTKGQIQEKEKELKREYRMLKEARMQSGVGWNDTRSMIEAEDPLWDNLITSFPKINKFKIKSFPLFDSLGELYDGQIAEGTYNVISTQPPQHPVHIQVDTIDELSHKEATFPDFEESWAYKTQQDEAAREHTTIEVEDDAVPRTEQRIDKRAATASTNKEAKEAKKPKKQSSSDIAASMDRYIVMRKKQFEMESALLASEKKDAQAGDYSIKRCISELMTMALSTNEKAAAFDVFKDPDNREIFLSSKEGDPQAALVWLRKAVAKL